MPGTAEEYSAGSACPPAASAAMREDDLLMRADGVDYGATLPSQRRRPDEKETPMTAGPTAPQNATSSHGSRRAVLNTVKGSAGNLVEWYDVYTYTVFLKFFEPHFFSAEDENSTVYAYGVFAITFLMRPFGSWYFGRFADRHGRRAALTASVSLMAGCSFIIAITPTMETIGGTATIILMLCRLVQGFATGGEYGSSATYMSEAATPGRRGFLSSFHYVTLVGGHVLAQFTLLILSSVLTTEQLTDWGWRIPFALGGVAAIAVFWMRRTMDETLTSGQLTAIQQGELRSAGSVRELFVRYSKPLALCFLVTMGGTVAFYTYSVTGPAIVKNAFPEGSATATWVNLLSLIFLMLIQPIGGALSDRVGRRSLLIFFGIGGVCYTWVLLTYLPKTSDPVLAFTIIAAGYIILTGYTSINALVKAALFPAHIRALGVGLGYALANSLFGGTAPLIYEAMKADMLNEFIAYVTLCIFGSLIVYVFFLKKENQAAIDAEDAEAVSTGERP